jgi:hypothetical protein
MDSVRAKHAAELEAKRKKLEEIRKRKASVRYVLPVRLRGVRSRRQARFKVGR